MAKTKYNFPELKQEYFKSDIQDCKAFFEHKFNTFNRHIAWQTTWWRWEKENYAKVQLEKARLVYEKKRQEKWQKVFANMDTARMAGIQNLWERLVNQDRVNKMQVREIVEALKHMRLELWETTENIKSTDNENVLNDRLNQLWIS